MTTKDFEIKIVIEFTATPDEFWADGYGPKNPTVDDVIAAIKTAYLSAGELANDYDGEGTVYVTVDGKEVYERADS